MASNDYTATRRDALAAITAMACVGTVPTAATASTIDRSSWHLAMATWQKARRHSEEALAEYERVRPSYEAACAAVPHRTFNSTEQEGPYSLSTAKHSDVDLARSTLKRFPEVRDHAFNQLVAADDVRREELRLISVRTGMASAEGRLDAATEAEDDAQRALLLTPAPDHDALLWKLEHLFGENSGWRDHGEFSDNWHRSIVDAYMGDARRLLAGTH